MKFIGALFSLLAPPLAKACPFSHLGGDNPHHDPVVSASDELKFEFPGRLANRKLQDRFTGSVQEAISAAGDDILAMIARQRRLAAKFIRLGFQDCVGGCNGCVDMQNDDNSGLQIPIDALTFITSFYQDQLTRADIWALAAMTSADDMQRSFRSDYTFEYYGRETCPDMLGGPDVAMPSHHLTTTELLDFSGTSLTLLCRKPLPLWELILCTYSS